jgi:carboxypeptidase PM20D1
MTRALGFLAFGLFLLLLTLMVRTASFSSRQLQVESVSAPVVDARRVSAKLSRAIQIPTVSREDPAPGDSVPFARFHAELEESFPRVHSSLTRETVGEGSLLYCWRGRQPELTPYLLMAHQDVVPVEPGTEERWRQPPFAGAIAEGYVWGRGALDDKGSLITILEAVETLLEAGFVPERTVYLAFGHDEELGGTEGAARIAEVLLSRGVELRYVLDEGGAIVERLVPGLDRPLAVIGIAEKGALDVELLVESEGGHSSVPPRETAVSILSEAVARVQSHPLPGRLSGPFAQTLEYLGPEMPFLSRLALANLWLFRGLAEWQLSQTPSTDAALRTTTAVTLIEGGVKSNVLPAKARAVVNFRIVPGESRETVLQHLRRVIGDRRVKVTALGGRDPSGVAPIHSPGYRLIERSVRQLFPGTVVAPYLVLGGTDSRHFTPLTSDCYRFSPLRARAEDLRRAHGTDERIGVENLTELVGFYMQLVRNSDQ